MIAGGEVTLFVKDVGAAVRFYVEVLGMKLVAERGTAAAVVDAGEGLRLALVGGSGPPLERPIIVLSPKLPLGQAVAVLENRGVTIHIVDDGPASYATLRDPDGNVLALRPAQ